MTIKEFMINFPYCFRKGIKLKKIPIGKITKPTATRKYLIASKVTVNIKTDKYTIPKASSNPKLLRLEAVNKKKSGSIKLNTPEVKLAEISNVAW